MVHRLCGPAFAVARQLAEGACWGSMLASEEVWREQGQYERHWVYNQGISMPWGPIISCYTLLPEGDIAYLKSASISNPTPCGMLHSAGLQKCGRPWPGVYQIATQSCMLGAQHDSVHAFSHPGLLQQMLCRCCAIPAVCHSADLRASQALMVELSTSKQNSAHGKLY